MDLFKDFQTLQVFASELFVRMIFFKSLSFRHILKYLEMMSRICFRRIQWWESGGLRVKPDGLLLIVDAGCWLHGSSSHYILFLHVSIFP